MKETSPLPIIACVSRVVTKATDRITGDRASYPLLVSIGVVEALKAFDIRSHVVFGSAAWVEILEDQTPIWAGCWNGNVHLWVQSQFGEIIDLNVGVSHRTRSHTHPDLKPLYSPPLVWSKEVPKFYRYKMEGIAEIELSDDRDQRWLDYLLKDVQDQCSPKTLSTEELDFPDEAMICPGRKLLDSPNKTFQHFDRALSVHGIPPYPF